MEKTELLDVVENAGSLYLLLVHHEEGDAASAIGSVYRHPRIGRHETADSVQMLATGDTLRNLWLSPEGHLCVASADEFVGTTAPVRWPEATGTHDDAHNGSPPRRPTALPRLAADGLRANVTALWGTSDNDVVAGTYGGHIFHWDGSSRPPATAAACCTARPRA